MILSGVKANCAWHNCRIWTQPVNLPFRGPLSPECTPITDRNADVEVLPDPVLSGKPSQAPALTLTSSYLTLHSARPQEVPALTLG